MCHKNQYEIKEGALFVADAHSREGRDLFFRFLQDIKSKKIKTDQLFLMGDIFDLLVGKVQYTIDYNEKYIELLNELSKEMEIYFFEGNHDFFLSNLFPNMTVFPLSKQPVIFNYKDKKVLLSHGDIATPLKYRIYTSFIRNKYILSAVGFVDMLLKGLISKMIVKSQKDKQLCKKLNNFKDIIIARMKRLDVKRVDYIVEGHFHQNQRFDCFGKKYINLASFACNKSFFIVQSHNVFKEIKL